MPGHSENVSDPQRGEPVPLSGAHIISRRTDIDVDDLNNEELDGEEMSETVEPHSDASAYLASLSA